MLIAIIILSLITIAYVKFVELHNIYGKIVIAFMSSYLAVHVCLPLVHLTEGYEISEGIFNYLLSITSLLSFLWFSVMVLNSFTRFRYKNYFKLLYL